MTASLRKRRVLLREELARVEMQLIEADALVHPDDCRGCQSWEAPVHPYDPPQNGRSPSRQPADNAHTPGGETS